MTSIQIWSLIYFTCISIATWIFFGVIFLQLKRFMQLSKYIPIVSKILTGVLILTTILGYLLILIPNDFIGETGTTPTTRPEGVFDTY